MNNANLSYKKVANAEILLKISYGLLFIIAGADKFFNFVTDWSQYVNPVIYQTLGLSYSTFIAIWGVTEILLGILVLNKNPRAGAYGIAVWFFLIIANLLSMWSYLDIAARDTVLAMGAIALAWIAESRNK